MTFDVDTLKQQIPHYLTAAPAQKAFVSELKALSEGLGKGYFIPASFDSYAEEMLQGDVWRGFQIYSFNSGRVNEVRGVVLSNSCDVSSDNERVLPSNVTFAPIIRLSKLEERFLESGLKEEQVSSRLDAIRAQKVTSMFYLPADGNLDEDYVVLLDDLHSMPIEFHKKTAAKILTLSMAGFYLFVFKLSVHFCRLHEDVDRSPKVVAA